MGKGTTNSFRIGLYTTSSNGFLNTTGGTVYVSDIEFHDHTIESPITTDFDRPYTVNTFAGDKNSNHFDENGNITRSFNDCTELPFITMATAITATDIYDYAQLSDDQAGLFLKKSNPNDNIDEWAIDPNAELRFWIKSEQDTVFGITIQIGKKTTYISNISISGAEGWQQVVIKSSKFINVSNIYNQVISENQNDIYLTMDIKSSTFTAGQEIVVGNRLELYSDRVYDKGDANMDDIVDARDIVKIKKQLANSPENCLPADIDNDGRLAAIDLGYVRNWLMEGAWK